MRRTVLLAAVLSLGAGAWLRLGARPGIAAPGAQVSTGHPHASPPAPEPRLPAVIHAAAPFYPNIGILAHLQGTVVLLATVDNTGAASAIQKSCSAEVAFCDAAAENFKTWEFMPGQPGQVEVTYRYKMAGSPTAGIGNPRIILDLPSSVTIIMPPVKPNIRY